MGRRVEGLPEKILLGRRVVFRGTQGNPWGGGWLIEEGGIEARNGGGGVNWQPYSLTSNPPPLYERETGLSLSHSSSHKSRYCLIKEGGDGSISQSQYSWGTMACGKDQYGRIMGSRE